MELKNLANWDRILRLLLGATLLWLGWTTHLGLTTLTFRLVALYPLLTAVLGWCPIYALLGLDSRG